MRMQIHIELPTPRNKKKIELLKFITKSEYLHLPHFEILQQALCHEIIPEKLHMKTCSALTTS